MKTSTEIISAADLIGEQKAIEYIARAGFDAWDFSMFSMCDYDWDKKTAILTTTLFPHQITLLLPEN